MVSNSSIGPVHTQNISRVDFASNEVEVDYPRWNGFVDLVEGEHDIFLEDFGTTNNKIVITKQVAIVLNWDTQIVQNGLKINDLLW